MVLSFFRSKLKHLLPDQLAGGEDKIKLDGILSRMHKRHQILTACYLPFVISAMIYSCYWAYLEGSFQKYNNPSKEWEACIVTSNYVQIPVSESVTIGFNNLQKKFNNILTNVIECPNQLSNCTNSTQCVSDITSICFEPLIQYGQNLTTPLITNTKIPIGEILEALRYIGFQSVIFSLVCHGSLNRALRHPSWLPATIALMIWCFFAILTYYTINPILPIPTETNGTTLTFLYYTKKSIFDSINYGDNKCSIAYQAIWGYLTILLCILLNIFGCIILACRTQFILLNLPNKKIFQPLNYTLLPVFICGLILILYSIIIITKIITSFTMLDAIHNFHESLTTVAINSKGVWFDNNFYPFQRGSLDINSLLFIGTVASVIRGYSRESVSAFRLSATMAFSYAITSYPGLVGAFRFYTYNDFQNDSKCKNFFLDDRYSGAYGYPSESQAETYCSCYRISLAASLSLVVLMHILLFSAAATYSDNQHRSSAIFEPLESQRNIIVRQSNLQKPTTTDSISEFNTKDGDIF